MSDEPKRMSPERLERYGVQFPSKHFPSLPTHAPMADGYWTPYHTAAAALDALRADLARVTAERDAEILRLRTAENAAGVAIDRLRQSLTDLPINTHPSEVARFIESDYIVDTKDIDSAADALRDQVAALTAERNEAQDRLVLSEAKLLKAEDERDEARASQHILPTNVALSVKEVATMFKSMADQIDAIRSERDAALADAGVLAAECRIHREPVTDTGHDDRWRRLRIAMTETDASAALSRHGGGE